ncbi:hypothetical protein [Curtobacterium sp. MCBA15_004]|uniref:hypothetical protein n=1 Tax=Curtobacterium sp. MCBA15_004 TaxID=1898733 RepID=UPI001114EEF4|nr:hypothetical protein [Curtobacterium sp. MCBA15_004]WIA97027.1 hypothetical protein QOL16_01160 [Curtobacterium sp. MCBA15_004]
MSIRDLHNAGATPPDRTRVEVAPPSLRTFLRDTAKERHGLKGGYRWVCDALGVEPRDDWTASYIEDSLREEVRSATWVQVFDLLEALTPAGHHDAEQYGRRLEELLSREGLAYTFIGGEFEAYDPAVAELNIDKLASETLGLLSGGALTPAGDQYGRALQALHARPADRPGAVRESVNALEAAAKILAQAPSASFGGALDVLFRDRNAPHEKALRSGLKSLYGYASTLPGARHGQHETVRISHAEAALVVNLMGSALAYIVSEFEPAPSPPPAQNTSWSW